MTLLLLHGALGTRTQLDALAAIVSRRRPVLQLEFEGHGTTPPRGRAFSVDAFVENVVAGLDSAGLEKVDVFGYSMGGYAGLALALAHPERVSTITTLGTKFAWDPASAEREARRLDPATIRAKVPAFAETLATRHAAIDGWEAVLGRTAAFFTSLGHRPVLGPAELARIHHRVRIMVGDRDASVSVEESATAYRQLPSGELMVLPRTPHPMEQVDAYRLADVLIELTS
jgi:pimeloyl-ACP methyl ester carboxylesterase